jgi:hypothetical protein
MNSPSSNSLFARLFTIELERLSPSERMLLRVAAYAGLCMVSLVALFVVASTYWDIRTYSGDDLRNRVVGARVMLAGHDPYTFFWQPGMPEELLDPVHEPKAHRLTVSPPTLLLFAVVAPVPFPAQRVISFVAEWLAMIGSLAFLTWSLPERRQRVLFLLAATLFVIATDTWRLHLERGQIYVFQLLALSAAIAWSRRGLIDSIPAGIALGVLALMRPNLLVIAPALLIMRQWRSSSALLATVGIGASATFLMLPTSSWQSYLDVGEQYYRAVEDPGPGPNDLSAPDHVGPVEGVNFCISLPNLSCSSFGHMYYVLRTRFGLPRLDIAVTSKISLASVAVLLLMLVWRRRSSWDRIPILSTQAPGSESYPTKGGGAIGSAFALIMVMSLNTEFFLPHRWGYADVMLLGPLALMLPALLCAGGTNLPALALVLIGLVSGSLGQLFFDLHTATVLRSWLVMGALTVLAISSEPANKAKKGTNLR